MSGSRGEGLRFILGRAGSGKTHLCLREVAETIIAEGEEGYPLILLVPEQATYQMERALLERLPAGGTARARVLSFRRLAYHVLNQSGGAARPAIGELGKRLVLQAILLRSAPALTVYRSAARKAGFVDHLARTFAELRAHRLGPDELGTIADELERETTGEAFNDPDLRLAAKLRELARLLAAFEEHLAGRFSDPDRHLERAVEGLPAATELRGACVWVDGFIGFTPAELRLLGELLTVARRVSVALCLDGRRPLGHEPAETDVFAETHATYRRLVELARALGVPVTAVEVLDGEGAPRRFAHNPALAHIEANFFTAHAPAIAVEPRGALRVVAAADPRAEVEAAAAEIVRLCRDEGFHPREIAVIVRDFEPYADWIARIFPDYEIPYFLDRKHQVGHHPLLRLVRAALEVVTSDWATSAVLSYLKSDLVPVDRDEVDELEVCGRAYGIRGRHWWDERPWSFISWGAVRSLPGPGGWPRLDAIRRRALAELVAFDRRVRGEGSADARSIGAALFELLTALAVPERLAAWRDEAERAGDVTAAREHGQVWDALVGLLDEMAEALGGEPLTVHDYREIFEAGLDGLRIGLIPPALDQVLVGAIDRSRQPDLRAVLLLGLNEGVFPAAPGEDPILDDEDRRRLARAGYELAADSRRRLYRERYLAYIALTRPRERLWLSYSTGAPGGGQRLPSPIIQRLRALFRDLDEVRVSPVDGRPAEIQHPQRLMGALLRHLRWRGPAAADPAWLKAQRWLARHPRHGPRLRRLLPALEEPRPVRALSSEVRAALYRDRQLSVSRLERQAICPFWRFAAHDLRLEPDPSGQPDALSLGAWLHEALRAIGEHVAAAGRDWASLEPDEQQRLVARALAPLRTWLDEGRLSASARTGYLLTRLERTLRWTVGLLVEHARRSEFRPVAHELAFGEAGGLPPLILASDAGPVALRGRIDRVDVAEVAGQTWLRVIDYKSGRRSLPLADVYHGLALQLPLYLAVAVAGAPQWLGRPAQPAGAYYLPLAEPIVDDPGDGDKADRRRLAAAKLAGLTVRDAAVIRAMDRRIAGWSEIVQAGLSDRTGEPFQDDRVAPLPDLEALLAFARARAAQLAGAILAGRVAAHPYRRADGSVPCGSCPFGSVCRFEGRFGWHRELPSLGPDDVWQRVRAGRQQEAGDLPRPLPGGDDR